MMFPGMNGLDPSKMTPEVIAEITQAMQMLRPEQMMKLQTLMHNSLGGFDVSKEMQELEKTFPEGFRERMARVLYLANGVALPPKEAAPAPTQGSPSVVNVEDPKNVDEARLVILRSVSQGLMSPEEALKVLF
jgi:hypothetical protein